MKLQEFCDTFKVNKTNAEEYVRHLFGADFDPELIEIRPEESYTFLSALKNHHIKKALDNTFSFVHVISADKIKDLTPKHITDNQSKQQFNND